MMISSLLGSYFGVTDMIWFIELLFMYLGHNTPFPHPYSTLSYDTQPVMQLPVFSNTELGVWLN